MENKKQRPYGAWPSQITTDLITREAIGLGQVQPDGDWVYWTELRPSENGRTALVRGNRKGVFEELTSSPYNLRSRVHEYGGGTYTVSRGVAYFVNSPEQYIYRLVPGDAPELVVRRDGYAFADLVFDESRNRLFAVAEAYSDSGENRNFLAALSLDGQIVPIADGADFYAAPRVSPDGKKLMWLEWNHPNMPWDGSCLYQATINDSGLLGEKYLIAGGLKESIFQPEYGPDGALYYVSDRSGYWNIYRHGEEERHYAFEAEFGLPHWVFGMRCYDFLDSRRIVCCYAEKGDWKLGVLDLAQGQLKALALPWCQFESLRCHRGVAYFNGARRGGAPQIAGLSLDDLSIQIYQSSFDLELPDSALSLAEKIVFPTENNLNAFGYLYMPANDRYCGPDDDLPPLIVKSHGGPTGQAGAGLSLKIQFWTSRGFAVFDVNYGGSTGFGRKYRERLIGNWGITDVDDCVNAARHLMKSGRVDPEKLIVAGGSAGGYTALAALTFKDIFKAGCSAYGIGDLTALAEDTHKFESRYLDNLIGPWPEKAETYRQRSPVYHSAALECPIIFLQGAEDKVVPPNQAEMMVDMLREKKLPVAYLLFEGEGHGFRKAETIARALNSEWSFYAQIFGFATPGLDKQVEIENL